MAASWQPTALLFGAQPELMAAISKLSSSTERQLRSSLSVASVSQCTEELVFNSLEANSGWIKIKLNLPACAVEVLDDGHGMPMEELAAVGTCTPAKKQVQQGYALWGRSLSNIAGVAERVTVVSRGKLSLTSYQKTFHKGVDLGISPAVGSRISGNTQVVVEGIFYSLPVRQKSLDCQKETTTLISFLEHMSLIYPEVFFALEDAATRKAVLQLPKCRSTIAALSRLASVSLTRSSLAPIEVDHACFNIKGYVAKQVAPSRNHQYIFINRRPIIRGSLHESVNRSIAHRCNQLGRQHMQGYTIVFLNISCDRSEYSLYSDALHSEAEFKKQQEISTAFDKVGKCIAQHLCWSANTVHHLETSSPATAQPASSGRTLSTPQVDTLSAKMLQNSGTAKRSYKSHCVLPPDTPSIPGTCESKALYPTPSSATESAHSLQLHSGHCTPQEWNPTAPCVSLASATATNNHSAHGNMHLAATGHVAPSRSLHQTWAQWNNPVFTTLQERLESASLPSKDQRTSRHLDERINMWKFSKDMFQNIEVIGQVDNKFIAGNLTWRNEEGDGVKWLVLVDQHAADERIRLEMYLQGVVPSPPGCSNASPPPSKLLSNPISISGCVSNMCRKPTKHFVQAMSRRGFTLQIKTDCGVIVKCLPFPLVETVNERVMPVITTDQLKDVLVEFMECTEAGQPMQMVPPSLLAILKSLACHSAIRFGDPLTLSQSQQLIADLQLCDLPFQCAHGRPSITPLIRLTAER